MIPERERFSPSELAVVLSHYDLGVIESAKEYARGSRRSPKLLLHTPSGRFLLKRRAQGRDLPERVLFAHQLLQHLRQRRFPVPALVTTRDTQESMLVRQDHVYELFEYVKGDRYNGSLEETEHAGKTLARFHRIVGEFESAWFPTARSFHAADSVKSGLNSIPTTTASHDSVAGHEAELLGITQELYERYEEATAAVNRLGFSQWPEWITHGDWHPGNMLFAGGKVAVVLDFDSARMNPRVTDVANGLLQFSILRSEGDPSEWPEFFDLTRMRRFFAGYLARGELPRQQRQAMPELMIESMVAECVFPIAATGSFGHMPGFGVLQMLRRKVRWLLNNRQRIMSWLME
ncbi:MAG: phosphotransferase [Planctomycetes bacterium]|nr:phosphotransferase [Planctomycetota bacterium]